MVTLFIPRPRKACIKLQFRAITTAFIILYSHFAPQLAVAGSAESPRETPISYALPVVREAVLNTYSLVSQPVVGAAWIATARIGVSDHSDDSRLVWSTALSTARSAFAYDVSKEIDTSAALLNGYAEEALRGELSDDEILKLFAFLRSPAGRQYLDFELELDGIVDYANSRVLLQMALGQPPRQATTNPVARADNDRRRHVLELSRSAAMLQGADRLLSSSDRLPNYGPAPWDAVLGLVIEPHESSSDVLLVQYQSSLDRLAKMVDQVSAVIQQNSFRRAQMAAQEAEARWMKSLERDRLISAVTLSMGQHLPCWQSLFRDNKEIQCGTFAPH
jgi:hypothetical protein